MARGKNAVDTEPLRVSLTPGIMDYLSRLVQTGLYGKTPAGAAERLIERGIETALKDGTIPRQALGHSPESSLKTELN